MDVVEVNQKGIFFTIMALFLILSVMALNASIEGGRKGEQRLTELGMLISVNNKYANIYRIVIDLRNVGEVREINERILPFEYDFDGNSVEINQRVPLREINLRGFFNVINTYEIFLEDDNFSNVFDGMHTDVNTVKNSFWGGDTNDVSFLIEPFCTQYRVNDVNRMVMEESGSAKCESAFDMGKIRRFDVNLEVRNYFEDYNRMDCGGVCPQDDFNSEDSLPYYNITVLDANCGFCELPQKTVSEHFDPSVGESISISCQGGSCFSDDIYVVIGNGISVEHESEVQVEVNMKTTFTENVEEFFFLDFNVAVEGRDFNIVKTNNPEGIP